MMICLKYLDLLELTEVQAVVWIIPAEETGTAPLAVALIYPRHSPIVILKKDREYFLTNYRKC